MSADDFLLLSGARAQPYPPPVRPPLSRPTSSVSGFWAVNPLDSDVWYPIPDHPDKAFYRGNFCGIRVPNAPLLPGMAGYTLPQWKENREPFCPPFMAQDILRYYHLGMTDVVGEYFRIYADVCGYTHYQVSVCHAVEYGLSVDELVSFAGLAKAYVSFNDCWWLGGIWGTPNQDWNYWRPIVAPWMDPLLANGLVDTSCVAWQGDQFNKAEGDGGHYGPLIRAFSDTLKPHGVLLGTHNSWSESNAFNIPYDPWAWWQQEMNGVQDFWFDQVDVWDPADLIQSKYVHKARFVHGGTARIVAFESSAQAQFDCGVGSQPQICTEDQGDAKSYYLICTKCDTPFGGYGNGGRRPDGSAL